MKIMPCDIQQMCRLCLNVNQVDIDIFNESELTDINNVYLKIQSCLTVNVSKNDDLPKRICTLCSSKLDEFHNFRNDAANAEKQLTLILEEIQLKVSKSHKAASLNNNQTIEDREVKKETIDYLEAIEDCKPFDDVFSAHPSLSPVSTNSNKETSTILPNDNSDCDDHFDYISNESNRFIPIVELSEGNWPQDDDTTKPSFTPQLHAALKKLGYKNPFIYPERKNRRKQTKKIESKNNTKWQCMICSDIKRNKDELIEHYEKHKSETETLKGSKIGDYFMCPVCLTEFTSLISYEKHVELNHSEKRYDCELCNKTFKNLYSLSVHNHKRHNSVDKEVACAGCDYVDDTLKSLRAHIRTAHEQQHAKYRCEICNKGFSSASWYQEHKNFHTGAMPFECDVCLKSFPYTRYLIAHKKNMHPEMFTNVPINHECDICGKKFAHKKSLVLHLRGHTGESAVLCDMCGKSLSSSEHLKQHLRIHTGYKPHCCSVCGKGFAKKCNLTLHERVHSGEKPHICNVCGKGFSQRSTLVIHGRYHSGERPYQCQICGKGFVAKGLLGVHMKTCIGISD